MRHSWVLLLALAAGCGAGRSGPAGPSGSAAAPARDPALEGLVAQRGGAAGGPIEGKVDVAVFDAETLRPLPGAVVALGQDGALHAAANGAGEASFVGLRGPQTVTAAAPGYSVTTFRAVNARKLALPLLPLGRTSSIVQAARRQAPPGTDPAITASNPLVESARWSAMSPLAQPAGEPAGSQIVQGTCSLPAGLGAVQRVSCRVMCAMAGADVPVQIGGGTMEGIAAPSFRAAFPAAPDASFAFVDLLVKGDGGFGFGRASLETPPQSAALSVPVPLNPLPRAVLAGAGGTPGAPSFALAAMGPSVHVLTVSGTGATRREWNVFFAPEEEAMMLALPVLPAAFAALGLIEGTYEWNLSSVAHPAASYDSLTLAQLAPLPWGATASVPLRVGAGPIPEGSAAYDSTGLHRILEVDAPTASYFLLENKWTGDVSFLIHR